MDNFVHLHLHSTYSFTDGYGLPEQYIARAKDLGQPGLGVTDHGNISAHYKWYKGCKKNDIKPILGCEMYIVETLEDVRERDYSHITVLAKNNIGYRNLTKLVTKAWCEQFYYKPRITFKDLFDNQEGLIVLSGCLSSPVMQAFKNGQDEKAEQLLYEFKNNIDDFYIELMAIDFEEGKDPYNKLVEMYTKKLKKDGFKWVATSDCHYVNKEHAKTQELLLCIQSKDRMSRSSKHPDEFGNAPRWAFDQETFYLKSREEMERDLKSCYKGIDKDIADALDNSVKIMESVDFTFPTAEPIKFPIKDREKMPLLRQMCFDGLKRMGKYTNKEYTDRIEYELDIIQQKNFIDYFLVIQDLIMWAKNNGILVGPARGSAAGSLACCAIRITEVDPIEHDLLFQRFIDINREDLPDIDLDFEDAKRHLIKEYLDKKYGHEHVGNLPTFAEFKGRSTLDDIGRAYEIPASVIESVKNLIIERSGGDSRASMTIEDTFTNPAPEYKPARDAIKKYPELRHAIELEGQFRQMGQHAAGFIVSNEPITNFCAIYKVRGEYVISLDYKDASSIGLLKIDLLGLNTLSIISKTAQDIKNNYGVSIDFYSMKMNDPKVYKGFIEEKLFGIFQFDGQAVNQVCRQIKPDEFESLSAISALARPGPLNGGSTTAYIHRRAGRESVSYSHKLMVPYTKGTYGVVVYQEQVMMAMREIGKMSWKDTAEIRRLISKSLGEEYFNTFKDKFASGAKENGLKDEQIDAIWNSVCTFGAWAFNKSHSVSYTIISYWTMWLKVYYPMEFYAATLSLTPFDEKKKKVIKEYKRAGYKVLPVDINKSKETFSLEKSGIRIGFENIKGIGPGAAESIVKHQPYTSYWNFLDKTKGKRVTETSRQNLVNLGAFDALKEKGMITLFGDTDCGFSKTEMSFQQRMEVCPWDVEFGINDKWMPFIKKYPKVFKDFPKSIEKLKSMESANDIVIWGMMSDKNLKDVNEVASKAGGAKKKKPIMDPETGVELTQFLNFILEDDTDFITVRVGQLAYKEYGNLLMNEVGSGDVIMIRGKMGSGIRMFFANKILSMRHFKEKIENGK